MQELAVSGLAAVALYAAGQHLLGWALGLLSVAYHALVYLQGDDCSSTGQAHMPGRPRRRARLRPDRAGAGPARPRRNG